MCVYMCLPYNKRPVWSNCTLTFYKRLVHIFHFFWVFFLQNNNNNDNNNPSRTANVVITRVLGGQTFKVQIHIIWEIWKSHQSQVLSTSSRWGWERGLLSHQSCAGTCRNIYLTMKIHHSPSNYTIIVMMWRMSFHWITHWIITAFRTDTVNDVTPPPQSVEFRTAATKPAKLDNLFPW